MESRTTKIYSETNGNVVLRVIKGHFATSHSHVNYFVDMTTLKSRQAEAKAAAEILARKYASTTYVDTIVCMDGCEVIGAYLAESLTKVGIMSLNMHNTIYVVTPEARNDGQLIFRDNMQFMIKGKHVILLTANATTGRTVSRALECIQYYDGKIEGISAIFSAVSSTENVEVNAIFGPKDISDYESYEASKCPQCKAKVKLDAIINSYGYSKL
ncbi:MAG: orotate phosphoribosyltransferase [Eubacteriales bacterium]|nr:orotate phosphoribosyltransferase [Eubacteriales bacterium]